MPVYNEEKYIAEAIESIINQTFKNWELIIIDDLSGDKTPEIAKKYGKKDSRIKVFEREKKEGRTGAANFGIKCAKGKYIAFLDGDDLYNKDKLKIEAKFMDSHPNADLVYGTVRLFGEDNRNNIPLQQENKDLKKLLKKCSIQNLSHLRVGDFLGLKGAIPGATVMIRKKVFKNCKFDQKLKMAEDYDLWFQMISKEYSFVEIKGKPRYYYRIHSEQSIRNKEEVERAKKYIIKKLKSGIYFK